MQSYQDILDTKSTIWGDSAKFLICKSKEETTPSVFKKDYVIAHRLVMVSFFFFFFSFFDFFTITAYS
jgi:hypothetical protein